MTLLVIADSTAQPRAFHWHEPIEHELIEEWLRARHYMVPESLMQLWAQRGGGELFESETILAPGARSEDDIDEENDYLRTAGLLDRLLVFHRGTSVSAVDQLTNEIVELDRLTFSERRRFKDLDQWYVEVLRREFADRYGLPR